MDPPVVLMEAVYKNSSPTCIFIGIDFMSNVAETILLIMWMYIKKIVDEKICIQNYENKHNVSPKHDLESF